MTLRFDIPALASARAPEIQRKIDHKTKPVGSLGKLERLALRLALIQDSPTVLLNRPIVLVFAGDHGIVDAGVSPYPQAVTQQMVLNFLHGGAAINVFARQNGMHLRVVDAGVNADLPAHPQLINAKVANGTRNFAREPAMTVAQCQEAIRRGAAIARAEIAHGSNVVAFGEMGIGNTSAAAALMSAVGGFPVAQCVGRGTGLDDAGVARKRDAIATALTACPPTDDPLQALAHFGGFEIAMIVGGTLEAAATRAVVLVDGFIVTAALLVAAKLNAAVLDYCVFSHQSDEAGHARLLRHLNADPLLQLNLRLGEGTGAALAYPLLLAAANFLNDMASFESAGVSRKID